MARSQGQGLGMSAVEMARNDAMLMDDSIIDLIGDGDIDAASNRDFVRGFVGKLQSAGQDIADMVTRTLELSTTGMRRIQAAMVQRAYGDNDLVTTMFESTDTDIRAIGEALKAIAGRWASMRSLAARGVISPEMDTTAHLMAAVNLVRKARRERVSLINLVNQDDIETGQLHPLTRGMVNVLYTGSGFLLLAYVGSRFVTEIILGRTP